VISVVMRLEESPTLFEVNSRWPISTGARVVFDPIAWLMVERTPHRGLQPRMGLGPTVVLAG
jgi:hypothetical protein